MMDFHFPSIQYKTKQIFLEEQSIVNTLRTIYLETKTSFIIDSEVEKSFRKDLSFLHMREKDSFFLSSGENTKSWNTVSEILSFLIKRNHKRVDSLLVLGGGASCDLGAFVASIYRRGIPLILVPTTLVSMVDASLGGKTAINYEKNGAMYKNSIGTFYPASKVYCSPFWLHSLNKRERISGIGEVLKTLWIDGRDPPLEEIRAWLSSNPFQDRLSINRNSSLWDCIKRAMEIKMNIVKKDFLDENGIREILNYGHSLGHALESFSKGEMSHGEAVIWGMWLETDFFDPGGSFSYFILEKIKYLDISICPIFSSIRANDIFYHLVQDKKIRKDKIRMKVLLALGKIKGEEASLEDLSKHCAAKLNKLPSIYSS